MKKLLASLILLSVVINILPAASSMSDGVSVEYIPAAYNLGIGYISPGSKLHVNGDTASKSFTLNGNTVSIPSLTQGDILFAKENGKLKNLAKGTNHYALKVNGNKLAWEADNTSNPGSGATNIDGLSDARSSTYNVYLGNGAGLAADTGASYSTGVGILALAANLSASGTYNSAFGYQALRSNNSGDLNTASGVNSLYSNTTGHRNTASGTNSLYSNTTGAYNTAVGYGSLHYPVTGSNNTAVGYRAGEGTTGNIFGMYRDNGTFLGYQTGVSLTTGYSNTMLGFMVGNGTTTGHNNAATGYESLMANTTGLRNTASGTRSLRYTVTGSYNTAVGSRAGEGTSGSSFSNGTFLGFEAGLALTTGEENLLIGFKTGDSITTGSKNIIIGYDADTTTPTSSNEINIGNTIYGNTSTRNVGIGSSTIGAYKLNVTGEAWLSTGTAWTTTSDMRLKNIDRDYEHGLADIVKLHSVRFHYKQGNPRGIASDVPLIGFIAQEVQPIFPEAVSQGKDGYYDFNIHPISVAMVNAVQELKQETDQEIKQLKISNEQLKVENEQLLSYLCAKDPVITFCPMIVFGRIN